MEAVCFVSYICWFLQEYGALRLRCFNLLRQMFQVGSFLVHGGGGAQTVARSWLYCSRKVSMDSSTLEPPELKQSGD